MACGLPVVTTRFNGASELLPPELNEFTLSDPHDHAALADRLAWLTDPAAHAAGVRAARGAATAWTFDDHYRKLLSVFERAAAAKRAA